MFFQNFNQAYETQALLPINYSNYATYADTIPINSEQNTKEIKKMLNLLDLSDDLLLIILESNILTASDLNNLKATCRRFNQLFSKRNLNNLLIKKNLYMELKNIQTSSLGLSLQMQCLIARHTENTYKLMQYIGGIENFIPLLSTIVFSHNEAGTQVNSYYELLKEIHQIKFDAHFRERIPELLDDAQAINTALLKETIDLRIDSSTKGKLIKETLIQLINIGSFIKKNKSLYLSHANEIYYLKNQNTATKLNSKKFTLFTIFLICSFLLIGFMIPLYFISKLPIFLILPLSILFVILVLMGNEFLRFSQRKSLINKISAILLDNPFIVQNHNPFNRHAIAPATPELPPHIILPMPE